MIIYQHSREITKLSRFIRFFASKSKPNVKLDEEICANIENAIIKPKNHPGRIKPKMVTLPDNLLKAMANVVEDHPIKILVENSHVFARHLSCRLAPIEQGELQNIKKTLLQEVLIAESKSNKKDNSEEKFQQKVKDKVQHKLRHVVYNWIAIDYNGYNSLLYLFARFAPDYAVLVRIFSEISTRDVSFQPRSFFDFGSGTGTATWAANLYWKKSIFEYFNVDSSRDMNDLAQLLLQDGRGTKSNDLKGTFYRQFLPASNVAYDLVVCAYTLLELPSLRSRFQTILNLWNKTASYLVIVEHGTNAGFKVINEVRDFILNIKDETNKGHVFSPCPHDMICPRFLTDSTPCNFEVSHMSLPFSGSSVLKRERYSYVILKKGKRNEDDPQWPRIVRPPLVKSKHAICRMCTAAGKLEEVIFTASKHGKTAYRCARSSKWGDQLPVKIESDDSNSCNKCDEDHNSI